MKPFSPAILIKQEPAQLGVEPERTGQVAHQPRVLDPSDELDLFEASCVGRHRYGVAGHWIQLYMARGHQRVHRAMVRHLEQTPKAHRDSPRRQPDKTVRHF